MNKSTFNPYWIGYYFGQNCILQPETGRWTLTGYFDGQVVCRRSTQNIDEEDCLMCPIEEVQLILKRINPFLFVSMGKFHWWIKTMSSSGYWMNFDDNINVIFEG